MLVKFFRSRKAQSSVLPVRMRYTALSNVSRMHSGTHTVSSALVPSNRFRPSHNFLHSQNVRFNSIHHNSFSQFVSVETNELFVLAAKILAKILIGYIKTSNLPNAQAVIEQFNTPPWWNVAEFEREEHYGKSEEAFRASLEAVLHQAFEYLMVGLMENVASFLDSIGSSSPAFTAESVITACKECLNVDVYAQLVGLFVVKNIRMEIDHPFQTLQISLMDLQTEQLISSTLEESIQRVQQTLLLVLSETNAELSDSDSDSMDILIPNVIGSAFLPIICTMNHNVTPNCTVLFTRSGQASVFVIKNVKVGAAFAVPNIYHCNVCIV